MTESFIDYRATVFGSTGDYQYDVSMDGEGLLIELSYSEPARPEFTQRVAIAPDDIDGVVAALLQIKNLMENTNG